MKSLFKMTTGLLLVWTVLTACTEDDVTPAICQSGCQDQEAIETFFGQGTLRRSHTVGREKNETKVHLTGVGNTSHWQPVLLTMEHVELEGPNKGVAQIISGIFTIENKGQEVLRGAYGGEASIEDGKYTMEQRWVITQAAPSHGFLQGREITALLKQREGGFYDIEFDSEFDSPVR